MIGPDSAQRTLDSLRLRHLLPPDEQVTGLPSASPRGYSPEVSTGVRRGRAWLRPVEVATILAVAGFAQVELSLNWDDGFRDGAPLIARAVSLVLVLSMLLRRDHPGAGLLAMWVAACLPGLFLPVSITFFTGFVPFLVMTVSAARRDPGWVGRYGWLGGAVVQLGFVHMSGVWDLNDVAFDLIWVVVAWFIGRRLRATDAQRRTLAAALAVLASRREEDEEQAREDERRRLVGEMHDVVGHAVSLMVLQVGAARAQLEAGAPPAPDAVRQLASAEDTGRRALDELRTVLRRLRPAEEVS